MFYVLGLINNYERIKIENPLATAKGLLRISYLYFNHFPMRNDILRRNAFNVIAEKNRFAFIEMLNRVC